MFQYLARHRMSLTILGLVISLAGCKSGSGGSGY